MLGVPSAFFDGDDLNLIYKGIQINHYYTLTFCRRGFQELNYSFHLDNLDLDLGNIAVVPSGQTYLLTANKPGFLEYDATFFLWYEDLNLGEILLVPVIHVSEQSITISETKLKSCYPNPFRIKLTLMYDIREQVQTTIEIYNLKGQKIKTLVDSYVKAGKYAVTWDGTNQHGNLAANGIYCYRMRAGKYKSTGKVALIR